MHRKDTGARLAEWFGPRGGPIVYFNAGWVDGERLVLAHSKFFRSCRRPLRGLRPGSQTWAVRRDVYWWACFAYYNNSGTMPGFDQRSTYFGQSDDHWQMPRSSLFPPQVIATWGDSSCSGGDWGDDGMLYTTGHDAPQLYALRLPPQGVALELVTTTDVPLKGRAGPGIAAVGVKFWHSPAWWRRMDASRWRCSRMARHQSR